MRTQLCLTPSDPQASLDRPWVSAWLLVATVALGLAIHMRDGLVHPGGIALLAIAIAACTVSFVRPPRRFGADGLARALPRLAATAVAMQLFMLLPCPVPDTWYLDAPTWPYYAILAVAAILVAGLIRWPARSSVIFPLILLSFVAAGTWVLESGRRPRIDVWTVQTKGVDAALHGRDPWSVTFEDIYHVPDLYGPGTVRDGIVHLGFPYPPLTLLLDIPGQVLLGDYRYSNLAAMVLAAAFIAYTRPGRVGPLVAVLFLFTPRVFLVLRNGWTEPTVVMLLAATVFCACRAPKLLPWALGLFLVSKQYMLCAMAPAFLLLAGPLRWREALALFGRAALIGALVSLPLALWNFPEFLHSNFFVAGGAKFRFDALSFFAYYANTHDWTPPDWIGCVSFLSAIPVTIFATRRAPRSPAGFAAAIGLVFIVFFALNKFAFCNYYYFVLASFCTSVAAGAPARAQATLELTPEPELVHLAA